MFSELFLSNVSRDIEPRDDLERRLLAEYGSVFVAQNVRPPTKIVFVDEADVEDYQSGLDSLCETFDSFAIELQTPAMNELLAAMEEAKRAGKNISPRFADSGKRTYQQTVDLWASRVEPALKHWSGLGRISEEDAARIGNLPPFQQVAEVLMLEEHGIYFAKDLSKSIIYSVAPPGTSQHLSMLALDVAEFEDVEVRDILAKNKWYQTVVSDLPHFTYLGIEERELPGYGLKLVENDGKRFWVPEAAYDHVLLL